MSTLESASLFEQDIWKGKITVLPLIIRKIYDLLPHKSHISGQDVSKDEHFEHLRSILFQVAGTGHFHEIIYEFFNLIDKTLSNDSDLSLQDHSILIQESIYITLEIVALLAHIEWNLAQNTTNNSIIDMPFDQLSTDMQNNGFKGIFDLPPPSLNGPLVSKCIVTLLRIRSDIKVGRCKAEFSYLSPPDYSSDLLRLVDSYSGYILTYLTASNYKEAYEMSKMVISKSKIDDQSNNLDFISFMYFDKSNLATLLDAVDLWTKSTDKLPNIHCIYSFAQEALIYWIKSHIKTASTIYTGQSSISNKIIKLLNSLLKDHSHSKRPPGITIFMSTLYALINHDTHGRSKTNKLVKELNDKLNSADSRQSLMATSCLIAILDVTACIHHLIDISNIQISKSYFEELQKILFSGNDIEITKEMSDSRIKFIAIYCMIYPDKLEHEFLDKLSTNQLNIFDKKDIISGILTLGSVQYTGRLFGSILMKYSVRLVSLAKDLICKVIDYENSCLKDEQWTETTYSAHIDTLLIILTLLLFDKDSLEKEKIFNRIAHEFISVALKCASSSNTKLQSTASRTCLDVVHDRDHPLHLQTVPEGRSIDLVLEMTRGLGSSISSFSQKIMAQQGNNAAIEQWLPLIRQFGRTRVFLIEHHHLKEALEGNISLLERGNQRRELSNALEAALIYCLTSSKIDICRLALSCLRNMVDEALLLEEIDKAAISNWSIMLNFTVYSELSAELNVYSTVALHKYVTKLFQDIESPSVALVVVWQKLYFEWTSFTEKILAFKLEFSSETQKHWRTLSGFLVSLLSSILGRDSEVLRISPAINKEAEVFLFSMVSVLGSTIRPLQEVCREILAADMNPRIYEKALLHVKSMIQKKERNDPSSELHWFSQVCQLLRSILARLRAEKSAIPGEIANLTEKIVHFADGLKNNIESLRFSIQVCRLIALVGEAKDSVSFVNDISTKNDLAKILMKWLSSCFSSVLSSTITASAKYDREMSRLYLDKCIELSHSLAILLEGLPIVVPDTTHEKEEEATKTAIFNSMFTVILSLLSQLDTAGVEASSKTKQDETAKISSFRRELIHCLSNLLSSNSDVGLDIAMASGYHKDTSLKLAFLEIFRNLLSQGTKLSDSYRVKNKYVVMADFLVDNETITLHLLDDSSSHEMEDFSLALSGIFEQRRKLLDLVKAAVRNEIMRTDSPSDLLRRNCVATKLLVIFARSKGSIYLRSALTSVLENIVEETDKDFINDETFNNYSSHLDLTRSVNEVVSSLVESQNLIPVSIRSICRCIAETTEEKFPGSVNSAMSSFFFLRFICPVLVSPEREGLLKRTASPAVKKKLLLITKIIQNTANGMSDAKKDIYGSDNQYAEARITQLLRNLASPYYDTNNSSDEVSISADKSSLVSSASDRGVNIHHATIVHRYILEHWKGASNRILIDMKKEKFIRDTRSETPSNERRKSKSFAGEKETLELLGKFSKLVVDLGTVPLSSETPSKLGTSLRGLLERNRSRDIGPIIDLGILEQGVAANGNRILIANMKNFDSTTCDVELLAYRYYQLLQGLNGLEYILVFDFTNASNSNAFNSRSLDLISTVFPEDVITTCKGIYYLNISPYMWNIMRHLFDNKERAAFYNPLRVPYQFITSFDLAESPLFHSKSANLDSVTESLATDVKAVFENVGISDPQRPNRILPVEIHIGHEYLQIYSKDIVTFISASYGHFNDVCSYGQIKRVFAGQQEGKFYLDLEDRSRPLSLRAVNSHEIVRAIASSRKRYLNDLGKEGASETSLTRYSTTGTIESKLPELLNMSLINLCSSDSNLQQAGYELVVMIPIRFNVNFGRSMRGGPKLGIPKREIAMALALSEAAASSVPHITYEFLMELFSSMRYLCEDDIVSALNYGAPWFKNVRNYVYQQDIEQSCHRTANLVRQLLVLTSSRPENYSLLALNIWPKLCLEDDLTDLLVDELIGYVTESALDDDSLETMLTIITAFPTMSMIATVLKKIRNLMDSLSNDSSMDNDQVDWKSIEVLVKICCCLTFDSIRMLETFLPEFCFLITSFLYSGQRSLRNSLHSMLINILHSFSGAPDLSDEKQMHLMGLWQEVCSAKGKMMFGLNEESKFLDYKSFTMTGLSNVEYCSMVLLDIIDTIGTDSEINKWRARWNSLVARYSFVKHLSLKCRSLVVLGSLSRGETNDEIIRKLLLVYGESFLKDNVSAQIVCRNCTLSCLAKFAEKLPPTSVFSARLFWVASYALKTPEQETYVRALNLAQATIKVLDSQEAFRKTSMTKLFIECRYHFDKEIFNIDQFHSTELHPDSFYTGCIGILMRGFDSASTREATAKTMETLLEVSARNNVQNHNDEVHYPGYIGLVYMLYLLGRTNSEMRDLLWIAGYPDASISVSLDGDEIPGLLKAYLTEDSPDSTITMYFGGVMFQSMDDNERLLVRFLNSLLHISKTNRKKKEMIYSMVRHKIVRILSAGYSQTVTKLAVDVVMETLWNKGEFDKFDESRAEFKQLFQSRGFSASLYTYYSKYPGSENIDPRKRKAISGEFKYERRKLFYELFRSMSEN